MDPLLALLHQSLGSIGPDCEAIKQNILASRSMESDIVAAIEARVNAEQRLAEVAAFCADVDAIRDEPIDGRTAQ
jgi:hypothetical protein